MSKKLCEEWLDEGGLLRLTLDAPPGNVLDGEMIEALCAALESVRKETGLKAVLLEGAGEQFCYGASVQEHLPGEVEAMLPRFHRLIRLLFGLHVPSMAAIRGRCLGGGLELVACCSFVFAAPSARFGQPEIRLGVFAPAASVLLPWRIGGGAALDLCVSGRELGAEEALRIGLVTAIAEDPAAAAEEFYRRHLVPSSGSSLRFAERALRSGFQPELERRLEELERLYLEELMATADALEGLRAFLEKRPARFENR